MKNNYTLRVYKAKISEAIGKLVLKKVINLTLVNQAASKQNMLMFDYLHEDLLFKIKHTELIC